MSLNPQERILKYILVEKEHLDFQTKMAHGTFFSIQKQERLYPYFFLYIFLALTLYIDENDINNLCIKLENGEKNLVTTYKLKLLELSDTNIPIPDATFPFMISIPSDRFHKIIRDTSSIAEYIDIKFIDTVDNPNTLIFSCRGEFASQTTTFTDKTTGFFINKTEEVDKNDTIVQGIYDLKNLSLFSKCGNLCNNIELYMMNKYPLFIKYQVGNLGNVFLVLSTINTNNNLIESDDENDDDEFSD